jgi:hypothetical protein
MMRRNSRPAPPPMPSRQSAQEANAVLPEPPMPNEMAEAPPAERAEHGSVAITPEAVCYRMAEETCGNCQYMNADQCVALKMAVTAGDSCNLFSQGGAGESPNEAMPAEQEMADQ